MNRKNMQIVVILVVVALAVVVVLGFFGVGGFNLFSFAQPQSQAQNAGANSAQQLLTQVQQTGSVSQLEGADIVVGTGDTVVPGDTIVVNYTGVLTNGTVFDASSQHGGPATFKIGVGQVIPGWDQGIPGMKVGGKRLLAIPPSLAYGANAVGPIPANSTLIFEVEIVSVQHASSTPAAPSK